MNLSARLATLLGVRVRTSTDLGASHGWTLHRAELADGRTVFVKVAEIAGAFEAETSGLCWLRGSAPHLVPEVLAADDTTLVLPWIADIAPTAASATRFGAELAALHRDSPQVFGAPWPGRIAELPLDNAVCDGPWSHWYAERRLAPYLPRAAAHLGAAGIRLLEQVIDRIDELAGPAEPPARLHGDLWSGNLRWSADRVLLIDPAAHGGHRETDLAMLALFGAPHLDRILAAYHQAYPLADGWRQRVPLQQLHPLLVHVVLFGAGYANQTTAAARAALARR